MISVEGADKRVIATSRGPVEFWDAGEGVPVLYFHGMGAASDLFLWLEQPLVRDGFRVIMPNRPGYFNTPVSCGNSAGACVDLAAEVLEMLQIEAAAVMGSSVGGFFAAAFAARHAGKARCLVLQSSNTHHWNEAKWLPVNHRWSYPMLRRPVFRRLLLWTYRWQMMFTTDRSYLKQSSGLRFADVEHDQRSLELCRKTLVAVRANLSQPAGIENDIKILLREQAIQPGDVSCPTLIIHDELDPVASIEHTRWAVSCIPGAEVFDAEMAGHFIWTGRDAEKTHARRADFLRRYGVA